jgi:hypothetical protein
MKQCAKVHIKLYNIWKFEKIGQNRGWVMIIFKTATRITHYIYNLIKVIKYIFPRLKLHEFECVFLYFTLKCIIWLKHHRKVHIKLYNIWKFEKIGQNRGWVMIIFKTATRITHYIYNLIKVIKYIFPRLKLHEFECVFLYFTLKCIIWLKYRRKVHLKLYNIWKFEKIGQNRGWVMRRFIAATRITF